MSKYVIVSAVVALVVGAGLGYGIATTSHDMAPSMTAGPGEAEALFWRNPMNPAITSPVFTQDEMGMDYIPVYAEGGAGDDGPVGTVVIDPVVVQNMGVRTAVAETRSLARRIHALGHVEFNEKRLFRLHPKVSGWVESLHVAETGEQVEHDTILLNIYSPDLLAAQQDYLIALANWERSRNGTAKRVMEGALARLELFDVPAHQIAELKKSRKPMRNLHIHSPFVGRVMNIGVREGQYVTPKDELYLIADLKRIWVYVDAYEDDLTWIKLGDKAQMTVRAAPGRQFEGEVDFIHPVQDRLSRTVKVRLAFDNADMALKPGMFANVVLHVDEQPAAVVVPTEAVVRSGVREQVFVAKEGGKFEPREVRLGISADGRVQVLSGVAAGEQVVTSAQFLIDSESKLREATAKMMGVVVHEDHAPDMDMSGMSMDDMSMDDMSMDGIEMGEAE